jgi:CheY-like chemotaxis protein
LHRNIEARLLVDANYQMLFVTGDRDAHGLLRKSQPDLTLMDVQIPDPNDIAAT